MPLPPQSPRKPLWKDLLVEGVDWGRLIIRRSRHFGSADHLNTKQYQARQERKPKSMVEKKACHRIGSSVLESIYRADE